MKNTTNNTENSSRIVRLAFYLLMQYIFGYMAFRLFHSVYSKEWIHMSQNTEAIVTPADAINIIINVLIGLALLLISVVLSLRLSHFATKIISKHQ